MTIREKKRQKNTFDLIETVHESEYANVKPGIVPDHRFEVTLEPDTLTDEKYQLFDNYQRQCVVIMSTLEECVTLADTSIFVI